MPQFFILGCQRTGTTVLRLILEAHSQVTCLDEIRAYRALQESPYPILKPWEWLGYKIPRFTEQFTDSIWRDYGLEERFPNPYQGQKILFMIRNPYDTIASMIKLRSGTSNWLEAWVPRVINAKFAYPSFRSRYGRWARIARSAQNNKVVAAALYWRYKTQAFLDYRRHALPVFPVCYEQLVNDPESTLRKVCEFLELPWEPGLRRHHRFHHSEIFANGLTVGDTDPSAALHTRSFGQWPSYLTPAQAANADEIVSDLFSQISEAVPAVTPHWVRPATRQSPALAS